jgi:hypothetical protein
MRVIKSAFALKFVSYTETALPPDVRLWLRPAVASDHMGWATPFRNTWNT